MLETLRQIVQDVNSTKSLFEALQVMVDNVRNALQSQSCSIFLVDQDAHQYVLMATEGLNPKSVRRVRFNMDEGLIGYVGQREEPINIDDAPSHPSFLYNPNVGEEKYHAFLGVPIIYHKRLLGVLAVQQEENKKFAEDEVAFLVTIAAQLATVIAHAEVIGELQEILAPPFFASTKKENIIFNGVAAVSGVGIGTGVVVYPVADLESVPKRKIKEIHKEIELFKIALRATKKDIKKLKSRMKEVLPADELALFGVYIRILENSSFIKDVLDQIREGNWAQGALCKVVRRYLFQFEAIDDEYIKERATDIKDLGRRILGHLQASQSPIVEYPDNTILIGEEVTASALAEVPEGQLAGIMSVKGSVNSHAAILARSLKIPTVTGISGISLDKLQGNDVIVDGYGGQVYINPSKKLLRNYKRLLNEEKELEESLETLRDEPAVTTDGHKVGLFVNTGLAAGAGLSLSVGAEGIGLFRTEMAFINKDRFPGEEEQYVIYKQMLKAFAPRPVVMRTLDVGGDKQLKYFPIKEDNPFLGWRGIRITLDHPEIFLIQLRALLRANIGLHNLQILLPMITSVNEVEESIRLLHQAYQELVEEGFDVVLPPVGVMIEVPSAVYLAKELAKRVEFISVGSNDLIQYLLAVDRNNAHVSNLYESFHPAVIRSLMQVVQAVHGEGKTVSICGEMTSDPLAIILLLAMDFDMLSMSSPSLPRIKWLIRNFSLAKARKILNDVLTLDCATLIRLRLEKAIDESGLGGLIRAGKK